MLESAAGVDDDVRPMSGEDEGLIVVARVRGNPGLKSEDRVAFRVDTAGLNFFDLGSGVAIP